MASTTRTATTTRTRISNAGHASVGFMANRVALVLSCWQDRKNRHLDAILGTLVSSQLRPAPVTARGRRRCAQCGEAVAVADADRRIGGPDRRGHALHRTRS